MKSRSDFVKIAIIVTVMAFLLPVPAAYSADWQESVNGYLIQCTVTNLETTGWIWSSFHLKYTFCNGNYWELSCSAVPDDIANNGHVNCYIKVAGPDTQACNGATYSMRRSLNPFPLNPGTVNAQNYVCGEQFKLMNVTVTPLK